MNWHRTTTGGLGFQRPDRVESPLGHAVGTTVASGFTSLVQSRYSGQRDRRAVRKLRDQIQLSAHRFDVSAKC